MVKKRSPELHTECYKVNFFKYFILAQNCFICSKNWKSLKMFKSIIDILKDIVQTKAHLLVEKPLCTTIEDCIEFKKLANGYPGVIWTAMEYRYMPPVARLIEEIHNGSIGDLKMLSIREHRFPFLVKVNDWNRFSKNSGGTLVEKCCHFFDLMRLIAKNKPISVYASGGQDVNHLDEEYDGKKTLTRAHFRARACRILCLLNQILMIF